MSSNNRGGGHVKLRTNDAKPKSIQDPVPGADWGPFDGHELNPGLSERFRRGKNFDDRQSNDTRSSNELSQPTLNLDIRKYVTEQENLRSTSDKDTWVEAFEIPKSSEIHLTTGDIPLPPNKIDKPFKSVKHYLKTQYSLLREDAVGPLREAIDKFSANPTQNDDASISIYEKVHVTGFTLTNMGIAARLKFSTKRAERRILWSSSKRLVSGTLVALTPTDDNFRSKCILAVVAARPLDMLERAPPEIDVYFTCPEDILIDPQISLLMIEGKQGYYEAYRHTLRALQKLSSESFLLSEHIIGTNTDVGPPSYLAAGPFRSLEPALLPEKRAASQFQSVNIVDQWPDLPADSTLDKSQWLALKQILAKRLAIIQGPPGTGKTHVSKVALQIMIENRGKGDPPIIVAAQTNHALDQLLTHVSDFDPNFIRLGGRSTNTNIKKRALYEVRQKERCQRIPGSLFLPAKKKLERVQNNLKDILMIFNPGSRIISDKVLFEHGVISAAQQKSLVDAANNWVSSDEVNHNPVQYWLGDALIPFEVNYVDDTFGFQDLEDEDLELEQLREIEAEHGVADEEDIEMLRGPWRAVCDDWTVARPSGHDEAKAKHLLDTNLDLWDIPERLRGAVYWVMKLRTKDLALTNFRQAAKEYESIARELKIGKWERDAVYLKQANVIGMTMTGLSKYRPLIASLKPKIVLIEEAAEVIEGPVTAACMEFVEHLILVGDHQQLQGHCSVRELEKAPYNLAVSMFERLVNIGMPFKSLSCQRRMIPEIRQLISSLYPSLEDHESVVTRGSPPPWGTGTMRSFFFHHEWLELKDEAMSTYNEPEARMVAKFYRHLLRHGIPPPAITILTFYNGQRRQILRELRSDPETNCTYNLVKTVDSYQGEENDIIILSLVRSNTEENVGFLNVDNRVCVALSRARQGFYIFGNSNLLSRHSSLWLTVQRTMEEAQPARFGRALPLTCFQHGRTIQATWPEDFDTNEGGCGQWCTLQLPCGHVCPRKCHAASHTSLECTEKCNNVLSCGHGCTNKCHEDCSCGYDSCQSTNWTVVGAGGHPTSQLLQQSASPSLRAGFTQRSEDNVFSTKHVLSSRSSSNWTSFASGGVKADDENRERTNLADRSESAVDLLDLSPVDGKQNPVKDSEEERISGDRVKFTQTYRPALPAKSGAPRKKESKESPAIKKLSESSTPNLMD